MRTLTPRLCLTLAALVAPACAAPTAAQIREHTYPQAFHYIARQEIHTAMGRLARSAYQLDEHLRDETSLDAEDQAEVVRLLQDMESTAKELADGSAKTNHSLLDRNLPGFVRNIEQARKAAEAEPPSYFLAGTVTGSCVACHVVDGR